MTVNIYDTANQLEREIRETNEYKALETAFKNMKADAAVFELFTEFQMLQVTLQQKQMQGQEITEEDILASQELSVRVQESELIKALMEKEQTFSNVINDLNQLIMKPVQELYQLD
ncbi:YlbF family regulator [Vagococcus sp.]|uniref:YlbF family regulator n=1 Tax=Vagococcus sp. TaxID=1933889 RepID=UPI003F967C1C